MSIDIFENAIVNVNCARWGYNSGRLCRHGNVRKYCYRLADGKAHGAYEFGLSACEWAWGFVSSSVWINGKRIFTSTARWALMTWPPDCKMMSVCPGLMTIGSHVDKKIICSCSARSFSSLSWSLSSNCFSFFSACSCTICAWKLGPCLSSDS